jgi:hypothetical protein
MRNYSFILCLWLIITANTFSQQAAKQDPIQKAVVNLYAQILVQPEEKIYVQTDKPYYMNGEKMYFRTFLLHASTLKLADWSRYVYVELVSPVDTVVVRQQIRIEEDKMFYGALDIPETLPEGTYRLRSYTCYLGNSGEEFYFSRPVFIGDPNTATLNIDGKFSPINDKQVKLELTFKDAITKEVKIPESLKLQQYKGKNTNFENPNNPSGTYEEKFNSDGGSSERVILIDYNSGSKSFKKYIAIPYLNTFPDISFYPEGGQLVSGKSSRMAFKALLPGAESAKVDGIVYDSKKEQVATFSTIQEGMGIFSFVPANGEKYYAQCNYKGQTSKVDLPIAKPDGYSLRTDWESDSLAVQVNSGIPSSEKHYLLVHHQGVPVYFKPWNFSLSTKRINKKLFVTGVSHVMLLDSLFRPISERLVFNNQHDQIEPQINVSQKTLKSREKVDLTVNFKLTPADTIPPSFAISVTDDKDVKLDTTTNIVSEILLSAELKGQITNSSWYFGNDPQALVAADLLMLTNGWRRYNVAEALQNNLQKPQVKPEKSQSLSGILKGRFNKTYKGGRIKMTIMGYNHSDVAESGDNGKFEFSNFEYPDSTAYFLMCYNDKGKTDDAMDLKLNPITYPSVNLPPANLSAFASSNELADYLAKANRKYLDEKGFRQINLAEVVVKANRRENVKRFDNHIPGSDPDQSVSSENIENIPPSSFEELFSRIPGVNSVIPGEGIKVRNQTVKFVLNGIPIDCSFDELPQYVQLSEIAQLDLFKDIGKTIIFSSTGAPVIAITTWPPGSMVKRELAQLTNRRLIMPLGFQNPVEFYSPKYDTVLSKNNPKADLRSTIYWKPNLQTDKSGNSSVSFYSADAETTYSVIVEGFTNSKKLVYIRKNAIIQVKK